jgi:hypothetical protein
MKNSQIFKGTLKFCWAKLGLQLGTLLADVLLFLLLVVLLGFKVFNNGAAVGVLLIVWYVLVQAINFALKNYLTYMLKAGHVALLALVVVVAIPVIGLLAASNHPIIFLFILWVAFKFVAAVKTTFVDSYILASMLTEFTRVAPETELSVALYGKLSKLSKKFKEMWEQAGKEEGGVATA